MKSRWSCAAAVFPVCALLSCAPPPADAALAEYVAAIKAVDNHAHPMRPIPAGAPIDSEFDALPLDGVPPFPMQARLRPEHPVWAEAGRALFGVAVDTGKPHADAMKSARDKLLKEQADRFPEWVLDHVGTEVMLANRVAMGPGLASPRFRWVPFADALMLPLDSRAEAARTPDTRSLYPREAKLLQRYLHDLGLTKLPATLDAFVESVVAPTLERQKQAGAVAIKFEAAYLRPLDFDTPDSARARSVYARYAGGGTPSRADYKAVEDFLFRAIAREAGKRALAVHIHVLEGFGGFYSPGGSSPALLESALNDSTLRATNFVIVHGGWPRLAETQALIAKPNVYADISMMSLMLEPSELARALRQLFAEWPEKILFGSDAFDGGAEQGWDQGAFIASTTARHALTLALTGMMRDGEATRERAETLARMVLRDNAMALYRLGRK